MAFDFKTFFSGIFKPVSGEVVTVMVDFPHGEIMDNKEWKERRTMASEWHAKLVQLAGELDIRVNPLVYYPATGGHNQDLPAEWSMDNKKYPASGILESSTIIISMPEFSASAPLFLMAKKSNKLRVGSMPGVARFMEETGLSADYEEIGRIGKRLQEIFKNSVGAEVTFSTGHTCYFDIDTDNIIFIDDGDLGPGKAGTDECLSNLPAGEVCCVPNEDPGTSRTCGDLPHQINDLELAVYRVERNRIVEISGEGPGIDELRRKMEADPGWRNIAEFAIGMNDRATVTGNILQDEKAGFHWAYGRSDHLGGTTGVDCFTSPGNVIHQDVVYARGNPVVAQRLEMISKEKKRILVIDQGILII